MRAKGCTRSASVAPFTTLRALCQYLTRTVTSPEGRVGKQPRRLHAPNEYGYDDEGGDACGERPCERRDSAHQGNWDENVEGSYTL